MAVRTATIPTTIINSVTVNARCFDLTVTCLLSWRSARAAAGTSRPRRGDRPMRLWTQHLFPRQPARPDVFAPLDRSLSRREGLDLGPVGAHDRDRDVAVRVDVDILRDYGAVRERDLGFRSCGRAALRASGAGA